MSLSSMAPSMNSACQGPSKYSQATSQLGNRNGVVTIWYLR